MKFTKIFALILAGCLLCGALIACDNGDDGEVTESVTETDANRLENRTINLVVKVGDEKKYEGSVKFTGYLGDAIELFTMNTIDGSDGVCFDDSGILNTVCDITKGEGQRWSAYFEALGKTDGAIPSIKTQGLKKDLGDGKLGDEIMTEGCTIILVLE